ncbi:MULTISPECIES: nucleotide exchange factor GrpE [unclassified Prochlorococcus]|uniref:nucleotide exchange factor GrpE n=1 Tax=unclassified Prochlorococcus TaxID=2627481 RepID=UPI00053374AB|nr:MULTISPECIES: nucleotide exchange factor GrpE [unclassified Prochlorococcus]KGG26974.1 Heat shock protein GrpE [Prochlorococcus sp. MIT 0701]
MSGDAPTPAHDPAAEDLEASVPLESVASMNSDEGQSSGQSAPLADNEARLQQLEQEHSSLREEHETLRSQYMRIAADFDNFRKRQSRDQDDLRLQLICTTLSEILPVVDNFERARQQLEPQGEEAQALHRSYQGLYKQLVEVLKQLGVASMRVVGQAFDPTLHEAVSREPSEEHPEDVVTEELQRGYHLNGRVLRHALVKVSMGPGPQSGASASSAQLNADSTATFQGEADPAQPGV